MATNRSNQIRDAVIEFANGNRQTYHISPLAEQVMLNDKNAQDILCLENPVTKDFPTNVLDALHNHADSIKHRNQDIESLKKIVGLSDESIDLNLFLKSSDVGVDGIDEYDENDKLINRKPLSEVFALKEDIKEINEASFVKAEDFNAYKDTLNTNLEKTYLKQGEADNKYAKQTDVNGAIGDINIFKDESGKVLLEGNNIYEKMKNMYGMVNSTSTDEIVSMKESISLNSNNISDIKKDIDLITSKFSMESDGYEEDEVFKDKTTTTTVSNTNLFSLMGTNEYFKCKYNDSISFTTKTLNDGTYITYYLKFYDINKNPITPDSGSAQVTSDGYILKILDITTNTKEADVFKNLSIRREMGALYNGLTFSKIEYAKVFAQIQNPKGTVYTIPPFSLKRLMPNLIDVYSMLFYAKNETEHITDVFANGYNTTGGCVAHLQVVLPKFLNNVEEVVLKKCSGELRCMTKNSKKEIGTSYIIGKEKLGGYGEVDLTSCMECRKISNNMIRLTIDNKPNENEYDKKFVAEDGTTILSNTPITMQIYELELEFR